MSSYYEKLLATGELKCVDEEIPFEIPQGWEWCRICHVAEIARGGSPRPIKEYLTDATDGVNWIKIGDTEKDSKYITSVKEKIKLSGVSKSRMVHKGDFLLTNSMSFGRPYITQVDGCIHDGWLVISLIEQSYTQDFFYYLLSSGYAYSQFASRVAGAVVQNLNSEKVATSLFPLPPYDEQKRIVQKIEEILPLVEKFGYNKDLLDKLNANLYSRFKKAILQEAIQGKLVPQLAEEGTAQDLLEQIKAERQKLVKEGKLKKSALNDSDIFRGDDNKYYEQIGKKCLDITEQIPFDLPESWSWARGMSVFMPMESTKPSSDFVYIDVDAVNNRLNIIDKPKKVRIENAPSRATRKLHENDLLFSMVRPYLKNIALVDNIYKDAIASTGFYVITPSLGYYPMFLYYLMLSNYVVDGLNSFMKGDNSPSINNCHIENYLYPLPPIEEQQRIVEKIEQLMQLLK